MTTKPRIKCQHEDFDGNQTCPNRAVTKRKSWGFGEGPVVVDYTFYLCRAHAELWDMAQADGHAEALGS